MTQLSFQDGISLMSVLKHSDFAHRSLSGTASRSSIRRTVLTTNRSCRRLSVPALSTMAGAHIASQQSTFALILQWYKVASVMSLSSWVLENRDNKASYLHLVTVYSLQVELTVVDYCELARQVQGQQLRYVSRPLEHLVPFRIKDLSPE